MSSSGPAHQRALAEARRSRRRDILLGALVALALLGFLALAFTTLNRDVSGHGIKGRITRMEFIPQPETQISIGSQGLHQRRTEGIHRLHVTDPATGREFIVDVDPLVYRRQRVGGTFYFVPPNARPAAPAPPTVESPPTR